LTHNGAFGASMNRGRRFVVKESSRRFEQPAFHSTKKAYM
jgi:hypothetical protein